MSEKFILAADGRTPLEEPDLLTWGRWLQTAERHVANDTIGDVRVSTVFLGLDHRFGIGGRPILWETMVFGGALDGKMDRYSSYEDAVKGHADMLARVIRDQGGSK